MNPIVEKIRKLLALARGRGATPGEAAAAAERVRALLLEHNLSMEQVDRAPEPSAYDEERHRFFSSHRHRSEWESVLVRVVTENLLCVAIRVAATREVIILGKPHNIAVAVHLLVYLQREIGRMARAAVPHYRKRSARERWQGRFGFGAVQAIATRLAARHRADSSAVTALVRRTDVALRDEVARRYKTKDGGKVTLRRDSGACIAGWIAGQRMPLNDAVRAGTDRALAEG